MVRAMTDDDDHDDDMEGLHFVRWKSERNSEEDGAAE